MYINITGSANNKDAYIYPFYKETMSDKIKRMLKNEVEQM